MVSAAHRSPPPPRTPPPSSPLTASPQLTRPTAAAAQFSCVSGGQERPSAPDGFEATSLDLTSAVVDAGGVTRYRGAARVVAAAATDGFSFQVSIRYSSIAAFKGAMARHHPEHVVATRFPAKTVPVVETPDADARRALLSAYLTELMRAPAVRRCGELAALLGARAQLEAELERRRAAQCESDAAAAIASALRTTLEEQSATDARRAGEAAAAAVEAAKAKAEAEAAAAAAEQDEARASQQRAMLETLAVGVQLAKVPRSGGQAQARTVWLDAAQCTLHCGAKRSNQKGAKSFALAGVSAVRAAPAPQQQQGEGGAGARCFWLAVEHESRELLLGAQAEATRDQLVRCLGARAAAVRSGAQ